MMTVITHVDLDPDIVSEWDDTMKKRLQGAEAAPGWIDGQILAGTEESGRRAIVGVWESVEHWSAWHDDPQFQETRQRLEELGARSGRTEWFRTTYRARRSAD